MKGEPNAWRLTGLGERVTEQLALTRRSKGRRGMSPSLVSAGWPVRVSRFTFLAPSRRTTITNQGRLLSPPSCLGGDNDVPITT